MDVKSTPDCISRLHEDIRSLKKEKDAVIMAHYYTNPEIQDVADFIGDSLALARIAQDVDQKVIVMCGVHFMGETARYSAPKKPCSCPIRKPDVRLPTAVPRRNSRNSSAGIRDTP